VKNHYGRTYFDEFMPTCLRGAVFIETQCIKTAGFKTHSVCRVSTFDTRVSITSYDRYHSQFPTSQPVAVDFDDVVNVGAGPCGLCPYTM